MAVSDDILERQPTVFSGANQSGVRAYNERLILSLLRHYGTLSKADIARKTGLSAQTISVINRGLETDGLVRRGEPVRGRIGQPSVPMALDPDGAFSIGLRIGRRSSDLLLMDFSGAVRAHVKVTYRYPTPERVLDFVGRELARVLGAMPSPMSNRVIGMGVASPFELWNWLDRLGAPAAEMAAWRGFDLPGALQRQTGFDVIIENDASSACLAELSVGKGRQHKDFAYLYVGSFIGGGIVINHTLQSGVGGNAGAFGSIPMPRSSGDKTTQLIDRASLYLLEAEIVASGGDPSALWKQAADWSAFAPQLALWHAEAAPSIATAIVSVVSVIDFPVVIIDGAFPADVKQDLVHRVRSELGAINMQGLAVPHVEAGGAGADARALGSALLPISARFLVEPSAILAVN